MSYETSFILKLLRFEVSLIFWWLGVTDPTLRADAPIMVLLLMDWSIPEFGVSWHLRTLSKLGFLN